MIDFRYHLVSLIAVFMALAVGVVLGPAPCRARSAVRYLTRSPSYVQTATTSHVTWKPPRKPSTTATATSAPAPRPYWQGLCLGSEWLW